MRPASAGSRAIERRTGIIYYVDPNHSGASDDNGGTSPSSPLATIGAAFSAVSAGDTIVVASGSYTETGLDLATNRVTVICRHGVVIAPATGDCLTISGSFCHVFAEDEGDVRVDPDAAGQTGVVISGDFSYATRFRARCASGGDLGFDVTGDGSELVNCRCSNPLMAAFKIQGDKSCLTDCCTSGSAGDTSIGFWVTNSCDRPRLRNCSSQGHETAGYQIDSGVTNGLAYECSSGVGDGRWVNNSYSFSFIKFGYDGEASLYNTPVRKLIEFAGAPTTYNIFRVHGAVRIVDIEGIVTEAIPNTASAIHLEAHSAGGAIDITDAVGAPDIDQYVVGATLVRNADSTEPLDSGNPDGTPAVVENTGGGFFNPSQKNAVDVVEDDSNATYIRLNLTAALASGAIQWRANWTPIGDGGFIEPA